MSKDRTFSLPKRKYKAFDVLRISYQIAPLQSIMLLCITILEGIIPTSILAMSTAYFVDTALSIFNGTQAYSEIYLPLLLLILLMGILNVLESMYLVVEAKIKCMLEGTLLPAIIEVQARLKYAYIEDPRSQEMIEITSDEMEQTFLEGLQAYVAILRCSIGIGSIIMLLMTQMWWVALLITFCSIPLLWVSLWAGKKNYEAKVDTRKYERRYSYYSDDILCGREAVQERTLFGYAEEMTDRYYENFKKASNIQLRVLLKTRLATKATSIALLVITMITALTLITPVLSGKVTPGMFMGIVAALVGMAKTLGWQLQDATKNIAESKEYMEGLTQLLAMETLRGATDLPEKNPMEFQKIEFKNVIFQYPNSEHKVLNGISFVMEKGKHYAFVGSNGAGKSTIIKMLTGQYTDYEGQILIDGKDIRTLSQSQLKSLFSVIYQDFSQYEISLKDNILLGDLAKTHRDEEVTAALTQAGLRELVEELPNGIETTLGRIDHSGMDVSGGQWQKIVFARSIMSPAPIKILDEPTAALDPLSENRLYLQYKEIMKGKTTIFISHRLASTKLADKIFVIDNGVIVQRGQYEELVRREGIYRDMFEEQSRWYSQ